VNVVELLQGAVRTNDFFFFNAYTGADTRDNFARVAIEFLDAPSEELRDFLARQVMCCGLAPHAKGTQTASFGDLLNVTEVLCAYAYKKNRKHLCHSVNTFLLGLLIYHNLPLLRGQIDNEIENDASLFSGGDVYGEFLFRWRLASLMHDLGNGVSLFAKDADEIDRYLFHVMMRAEAHWPKDGQDKLTVECLVGLARGKNALTELDKVDGGLRFRKFFDQLKQNPYKSICYDHGLVSALLILKVIDGMYSRYDAAESKRIEVDGHGVSFDRGFFDKSVMHAAHAVAIHNLDFYPAKYRPDWPNRLYDASGHPFAFLLKLADTLQEWNKLPAKGGTDYIKPEDIVLRFEDNTLVIEKYPKLDELRQRIDEFFAMENVLTVEFEEPV